MGPIINASGEIAMNTPLNVLELNKSDGRDDDNINDDDNKNRRNLQ